MELFDTLLRLLLSNAVLYCLADWISQRGRFVVRHQLTLHFVLHTHTSLVASAFLSVEGLLFQHEVRSDAEEGL